MFLIRQYFFPGRLLIFFVAVFVFSICRANDIERFEHIDSQDGLSQNNVLSLFCDHRGYMWFGTMDGLNRYDGYSFKVFKAEEGVKNSLTHNRISEIREDSAGIMWVKTYEGYYHYYIPQTEEFITFPVYMRSDEEKNSEITCFFQPSRSQIWLGSSRSGAYFLQLEPDGIHYRYKQFVSRGVSAISNNSVNFILNDQKGNIWIGTRQGLNFLKSGETERNEPYFNHHFASYHFTKAAKAGNYIYFGTKKDGIIRYNSNTSKFEEDPVFSVFKNTEITFLKESEKYDALIIGTKEKGLFIFYPQANTIKRFGETGHEIRMVFEDYTGLLWIKSEKFGLSQVDPDHLQFTYFTLTPPEIQPVIDDERPYIFEDSQKNLWIGTHGGGLALYNRMKHSFTFYRNNPASINTISSNFVHCVGEDKSGTIWVGTGQFNGGINRVIMSNPSFYQIIPEKQVSDLADNVVRCLFRDSNQKLWVATKSGTIYIYNPDYSLFYIMRSLPLYDHDIPCYNIYSIIEDQDGYIWMGSKGGGMVVSTFPVNGEKTDYRKIKFYAYKNDPDDPNSLSNNQVYSIFQDRKKRIWIGTYGGGINLVTSRDAKQLSCRRITTQNSTLSSNSVRYIFEDTQSRIWVATTFGLNLLENTTDLKDTIDFRKFFYNPQDPGSISYNDVIHIYEDSGKNIWFGTFGGGVNLLKSITPSSAKFIHYKTGNYLVNDAVFSILGDQNGYIWFSTEKGISKFNPVTEKFKNFDRRSGLFCENFSENTCCRTVDGKILFGSTNGVLVINPDAGEKNKFKPPVVITNFQLFNRNVDFRDPSSPLKSSVETTDTILLRYNQSSFSFEYAALSYTPDQNIYRFKLENFDEDWNEIGNQRKATYTNLSPGDYVFHVIASAGDETFSQPQSVYIRITPPWWKSRMAYFSYFILFVILSLIFRRIFMNYYRLQNDLRVERRINDIKLQFFTDISHEIRTPLTLILGPIDDIKTVKSLPQNVLDNLNVMERNGKRMLRLVNQLLDFRKIQKNKMTLKVKEIDLVSFVKDIYSHFVPIASHRNIDFRIQSNTDNLPVFVDPNKFDSVVFNILSNAFKYTSSEKSIIIHLKKVDDEKAEIAISDQGKGIPAEKISAIFERFSPLSYTTASLEGTGIGLNLSWEIMKLHKGDILVESEVGKGSCFKIQLLLGKDHFSESDFDPGFVNSDDHKHPEAVEPENVSGENVSLFIPDEEKSYKLLIVEDNAEIIMYLKNSLSMYFEIRSARNGKEGLELLSKFHPDLIITDIMMPEMDGVEMTKRIKENIETSHIPVIMLTAKSAIEDQITGVESGAEGYLLKPFNNAYLMAVVKNILKQREYVIQKYSNRNSENHFDLKITPKDDEFMTGIVKIIGEHYADPEFNVDRLVSIAPVSRTVLYNKLKGLTGLSPVDFLRQMRLKFAAEILMKTGRNVSETAYLTGFNDVKYFSKCFKELYGVSPKDYKKIPSES